MSTNHNQNNDSASAALDLSTIPRRIFPEKNQHFIGNEYRPGRAGKEYALVNPSTGREWCTVSEALQEDVDIAVEAAERALPSWDALGYRGRQKLLLALADLWEQKCADLALLECINNGTTLNIQEIVVAGLADDIRYAAGWCDKLEGRVMSVDGPYHVFTKHEPLGVCAVIGPWNFPLWTVMVSVAPALAMGNTLVVKPSEQTPLTMLKVAEMMKQVGFPPGVFNVVNGFGQSAGAALTAHHKVAKVAFTGSTDVGRLVMQSAAKSNLKQVHLELGGKSPLVIFDDADLDDAVNIANLAVFANNGEICTAGSRTYVHDAIYDKFVEKAAAKARAMKVGNPVLRDTDIGPMIDKAQFDKVLHYIEVGKREGLKLVAGGAPLLDATVGGGFYVQPTVFDARDNHQSKLVREEIFGPVQTIIRFHDLQQVVGLINDSPYGLAAGVVSKDIAKVFAIANAVKAGTVWVNNYSTVLYNAPFGGVKSSGFGRESGKEGIEGWTNVKTVIMSVPSLL